MTLTVTHSFTSAIADDPTAAAAGEVLPSHWNAAHTISGTADTAIGNAVSGGTSGSVLFVDGSSHLAQDNANFNWNDTTQQLNLVGSLGTFTTFKCSSANVSGTCFELNNTSAGGHDWLFNSSGSSSGTVGGFAFNDLTSGTAPVLITGGGTVAQLIFLNGLQLVWSSNASFATPNTEVFGIGTLDAGSCYFNSASVGYVTLYPEAQDVFALRRSTAAHSLRVYNTSSSSNANYERGVFDWKTTANVLRIGTENAGTGSVRNLEFVIGGTNELDYGVSNSGAWTFSQPFVAIDPQTGTQHAGFSLLARNGGVQQSTSFYADANGNLNFNPVAGGQSIFSGSFINGPREIASPGVGTATCCFIMNGPNGNANLGSLNALASNVYSLGYTTDFTTVAGSALVWNNLNSVIIGNTGAALATNATDGFLYIPTCAGTPTGTPTTHAGTVPMIYDTTNNKFYIYNSGWKGGTNPGAFT